MKKLITGVAVVFGLIFPSTFTIAAPPDDTFVVGLPTDTIGLEPAQISSRHTANIMKHIFGQLYSVSETGSIDPNLAESYKISDDGKEYTFTLKEGLTCHDGEALTAEDAAYSFNSHNWECDAVLRNDVKDSPSVAETKDIAPANSFPSE